MYVCMCQGIEQEYHMHERGMSQLYTMNNATMNK